MKINSLIDEAKRRTIEAIKSEDWDYLFKILEREPKQLTYFSEEIENVISKSEIFNQNPYEKIVYKDKLSKPNRKYYRFIPGLH